MNPKQRALTLNQDGKCIVCEVETGERTRGLCVTDYARFRAALRQIDPGKRLDFEAMLIEQGQLLESRQGQRSGTEDDVFSEAASKFLAISSPTKSAGNNANEARTIIDKLPDNAISSKTRKSRKKSR